MPRYPDTGNSMQIISKSWRFAALPALALACLAAASSAWAARTQEANIIPVALFGFAPTDADDIPAAVRSDLLLASDGNVYFGSTGGGKGAGAIGKLTPDGVVSTVYSLKDDGSEGVNIF